jgi:hypothetical protein
MVEVLGRRRLQQNNPSQIPSTNTTSNIKVYAQDPAYTDVDIALLHSIGITPLDDPKGFLEIDAETLVFSVSPNVPVKQVVADVCWPAAMIWNTVMPEEKENVRWEKQVRGGEEFWVVYVLLLSYSSLIFSACWMSVFKCWANRTRPFTTDPDSVRVRRMVRDYTSVPLRDSNEYFGDMTIYVR